MAKRVLYLECKGGAAGDMLMGALYGTLTKEQKGIFLDTMNGIWEGVAVSAEETTQKGIGGIHMRVWAHGQEEEHEHGDSHHEHGHEHGDSHHGHGHEHGDSHHEHEHGHGHHGHSHDHGDGHHAHDHEHGHGHEHEHGDGHYEHGHGHGHDHPGHHHHTSYPEILERIRQLPVSEQVRANAAEIYRRIGEAESKVHQTAMEQIHFHEVGSLDALADVVGSCLAIELLNVDEIWGSPICVGNGTVRCAHGILPVPAPAAAEIIKGAPIFFSEEDGERLTPTGAAVLKHFVQRYVKSFSMEIQEIGYGMGTREFENPTFVRAFIGNAE